MTYEEAMKYMESTQKYGSVLGMENITELLKRLGNPQRQLNIIHIAGTNGKGSVASYITSILIKSGFRTGRYISPVLFDYCERIQIDNVYIEEKAVAEHLSVIKKVIDGMIEDGLPHPTPFEIETAMSFLEFVRQQCDMVVLEVGMGGRYDATNIIEQPECVVFTPISMDHMAMLGDSLTKIAGEKAGIIKKTGKIITAWQQEEVLEQLQKEAAAVGNSNPIRMVKKENIKDVSYELEGTTFTYTTENGQYKLHTGMLGVHQIENAALAVEVIEALKEKGYSIDKEHIREGIADTRWKGRFDIISHDPVIVVDGAHNEGGALALRKSMDMYFAGKRILAVAGIFADKEYDKILQITLEHTDTLYAIAPDNPRSLPSYKLCECARKYCKSTVDAGTAEQAMRMALQEAGKDDVIVVYGSLSYLHQIYDRCDMTCGK